MRRVLSSKKKLRFINGALPAPPETDPEYEAWETCNNAVLSWINRSLAPHIAQSTVSIDNARELWLDLQNRFTKNNYFKMSNLLQDLHSMKQGDRTLTQYFTDMKILWDELENLRPTPSCSCAVVCTCAMSSAIKKFKDEDVEYVICFLKGLNDCYSNVRSTILTMDPLPTINKAYAMTSQQETLPTTPISDSTAFAVAPGSTAGCGQQPQGRGSGRNGPRQQMLCTHCKKTNHTVDNCYFKYGFPPGYRTKEQTTTMNISHDSVVTAHKPPPSPAGCNSDSPMQISKEDYNQLMALLHSSKKESNTHSHSSLAISNSEQPHHVVSSMSQSGNTLNSECFWILDSGASDHVCPHIKFFTSIHN